jgi:hypothetical protein
MLRRPLILASVCLGTACHSSSPTLTPCPADPTTIAPHLNLDEPGLPGTLTALILDGHTGAPVRSAALMIPTLKLRANTDSLGVARFSSLPSGRYDIRVFGIGFKAVQDSAILTSGAGRLRVYQLFADHTLSCIQLALPEPARRIPFPPSRPDGDRSRSESPKPSA